MELHTSTRFALAAALLGATALSGLPAAAQDESSGGSGETVSLEGETVEFVIPFSESGGTAAWANFYAPYLSDALNGQPTVVIRYRPGAGSTSGANWFQEEVESEGNADGTLVFGSSGSTQFPYLLNDPRVRYEYADWQVVLASGVGGVVYVKPEMAEKFDGGATGMQSDTFIYAAQGATSLDLVPLLAFKMLGLETVPVFGVEGRGSGRLMFERGEANIDYQTTPAYLTNVQPMVEQGIAEPIFTWGILDDQGNIIRDPTFPDMPTFKEVCEATEGCETSGPAWDAWKAFFIAGFPAQKMVFLPGQAPEEVVNTWTAALEEIIAMEDFQEAKRETLGNYPQLTGQAAQNAKELATSVSDEARQFVLDWLEEDYNVTVQQ